MRKKKTTRRPEIEFSPRAKACILATETRQRRWVSTNSSLVLIELRLKLLPKPGATRAAYRTKYLLATRVPQGEYLMEGSWRTREGAIKAADTLWQRAKRGELAPLVP